ncbi:MAG: right-handed parallel beta-helix repeat-containing protein [Candidatus Heimdallarchaeota archaeon]|nr:right-handed parallel beta-helix repeat-containing protein [Candidatus Heimdallarchaeota archaeon]MCK4877089.1 right-handed parallel beta-helix repeat-containing protein [Candidatus Heimdallarchaeota archaeon]
MNTNRKKPTTKIIALLEITLFVALFTLTPIISVDIFATNFEYDPQIQPSYTVHEPIVISNNGNFSDYGFSGTGLIDEPYVIKDYNITNHNFGEAGILVSGTTAFFVITDCYILARTKGIEIENVASGTATIINNTCRAYNGVSITLSESDNIEIINNTCHYSFVGISAYESINAQIIANNCSFNTIGIELQNSVSGYIVNNTCNNNGNKGMYITYSDSTSIINNTIENNANEGIYTRNTQFLTIFNNTFRNSKHGIDSTAGGSSITYNKFYNHVNGLYYTGTCTVTDNIFIGNDYGIMGLTVYSSLIQNNYCANNTVGIYVEWANYGTIEDNTCEYNSLYGIWIKDSLPPTIQRNTCDNNDYIGLRVDNISGVTGGDVLDNDCSDNGYLGLSVSHSEGSTIADNTCTNDGLAIFDGSVGDYLSYTIVNNIVNGQPFGIYKNLNNTVISATLDEQLMFINCHNLTIKDYTLENSGLELHLAFCYNVTLVDNLFEYSDYYGLYITSSLKTNITLNTFSNIFCGAFLSHSHNTTLFDNVCNNAIYGFHLYRSQYSSISSNTFTNSGIFLYENSIAGYLTHIIENNYVNSKPLGFFTEAVTSIPLIAYGQLILIDCEFLDIEGLTISNTAIGLQLIYCTNINVEKNTFNSNYYGIYLSFTTSSIIQENTVSYNFKNGIYLAYSDNNIFELNELRENIEYGIYIDVASDGNRVSRNNFYDNNLAELITVFLSQGYDHQITNHWYDAYTTTGNYWSEGHNGFYVIDGPEVGENRYDEYPLDNPAVPPIREFNSKLGFILMLIIPSLVSIPILRKKKRNKI